MIPVYSVRLTVFASADHPAQRLFDDVVQVCHGWLRFVGEKMDTELPDAAIASYAVENRSRTTSFRVEHFNVDNERVWRVVALHPYNNVASNIQMRIEIQARDCGGEVVVTLRLLLGSIFDSIRPISIDLRRPRLIIDLLDAFPQLVSSGNMRATRYATYLESADQVNDVIGKIVSLDRTAPIIVISRTEQEQLPLTRMIIDRLANQLAGLARVCVLPDHASAFALTTQLTKSLSCYDGAIRIYWPNFRGEQDRLDHPLWTLDRLNKEQLHDRLPQMIFNTVAAASALGISSDAEARRLYRTHDVQERAREQADLLRRMEEQIQEAKAGHETDRAVTDALVEEGQKAINELREENTWVINQIDELEFELRQLKEAQLQIQAHNAGLEHIIRTRDDERSDESLRLARVGIAARNLVDIMLLVQELSSEDYLTILPAAFDSAKDAPYQGPLQPVLDMLICIRSVARRYAAGDSGGHKRMFEEEGEPGYRANVSNTAHQEFRNDYRRLYSTESGIEEILLGPHISNGGGAPKSTVVIYWYIDDSRRKYVIGHVGRHLRGKRDT